MRVKAKHIKAGDIVVDAIRGQPREIKRVWVWELTGEYTFEYGGISHAHYQPDEDVEIWRGKRDQ